MKDKDMGLRIKDLADFDFLSNVKFSPTGKRIAFNKHSMDVEENEYESSIYIYRRDTENVIQLTTSGKDKDFVWLDDEEILFISERDMDVEDDEEGKEDEEKKTKFFKINIHGGEASHFDTIEKKVTGMKRSGPSLYLTIHEKIEDEGVVLESKEEKKEDKEDDKEKRLEEGKDYHELDEIPFWSNETGFSNKRRNHLYSYDPDSKDLNLLVGGSKMVLDFDVQGHQACLNLVEYEDKMEPVNFLHHLDLEKGELSRLTEEELSIERVRFLDDKKIIFEATDMEEIGLNTNKELYLYDLEKGKKTQLTQMNKEIGNKVLTDLRFGGGKSALVEDYQYYFTITENHDAHLYKYDLDQGLERLTESEGTVDFFDIKNGKIAHIGFREDRGQELYMIDEPPDEERITDFNEIEKELADVEHFDVNSNDKEIDAYVLKPIDFEEGERYPTILNIHGGPKGAFGEILFHELQVLANNGYAVIFSNILGSAGKGNEFADIIGKYGREDFDDLMKVVEEAERRFDFIDENNWVVTGGSYGGFMTNWIVTQTDKFKAAVTQRCISNWISMFSTTDIGYYFVEDQLEETPWSDFEELWDRSPLKYADKVETPLLFIHSRKDYRCWESEAIQMFTALKYHGVESKILLFEDENHDLSRNGRPKQRMKRLEEMVDWFDHYIDQS